VIQANEEQLCPEYAVWALYAAGISKIALGAISRRDIPRNFYRSSKLVNRRRAAFERDAFLIIGDLGMLGSEISNLAFY
jgi:hypothetical protein